MPRSKKSTSFRARYSAFRKRKSYSSKKSSALVTVMPRRVKERISRGPQFNRIPKGLYSQDTVHYFMRDLADATVYVAPAGTLNILDNAGNAVPWLFNSGLGADWAPSATGQFGLAAQFAMAYIPSSQEYTALFNEYQITKVQFCFFFVVLIWT